MPRKPNPDIDKIKDDYNLGHSIIYLAEQYDLSRASIYRIVAGETNNNNNNNNNNKLKCENVKQWSPEKFNRTIFKLIRLNQMELVNSLMALRDKIVKE